MATANPFDLLVNDDNDDPEVIASLKKKEAAAATAQAVKKPAQDVKQAKLPSKPLPPAQAVRETNNETGHSGGRGGRGRGGRGGFNRDAVVNENFYNGYTSGYRKPSEEEGERTTERRGGGRGGHGRGGRGGFNRDAVSNENFYNGYTIGYRKPSEEEGERTTERRGGYGGRRGDFSNGEDADGERPRRNYERHSGSGHGNEVKREGAGRGNWGTPSEDVAPEAGGSVEQKEKIMEEEKPAGEEGAALEVSKDKPADEPAEQDPEEKLMTLEEYEKQLEEKRKALLADKPEERKVDDKEFQSMQQLSNKKSNDDVFIKLRADKEKQRKEAADKEEKAKKAVSINEFLKPAGGERYYGGRGRGRGRGGPRSGVSNEGNRAAAAKDFAFSDPELFPSLGAK